MLGVVGLCGRFAEVHDLFGDVHLLDAAVPVGSDFGKLRTQGGLGSTQIQHALQVNQNRTLDDEVSRFPLFEKHLNGNSQCLSQRLCPLQQIRGRGGGLARSW